MMNKRVKEGIKKFHTKNPRIKFCLGTLALVGLCVMFLIIATFTQIKFNMSDVGLDSYLKFEYIPQIPVVLFIAALLGECWGLLTILLYIGFGLTGIYPVFALGGGFSYVFQYNFGYILAYIFAVLLVSKELKKGTSFWHLILATLYGVFIIHIIGILYLTRSCLYRFFYFFKHYGVLLFHFIDFFSVRQLFLVLAFFFHFLYLSYKISLSFSINLRFSNA